METVRLGRTGISVSLAGLGCGGPSRLGRIQGQSVAQAKAVIEEALRQGITFIDTAVVYDTEAIIGEAIAGRRKDLVLCTKIPPITRSRLTRRRRPPRTKDVRRTLEESLGRLKTDYHDIVMLHGLQANSYRRCRDALVPVLQDLQGEGKLRFIGVSESFKQDPEHLMLQSALGDDCWDVIMMAHTPPNAGAGARALRQAQAKETGVVGMCAASWISRNNLSPQQAAALLRDAKADRPGGGPFSTNALAASSGQALDQRHLIDASYRFCRNTPGIDVVLIGTGNPAHLRDNLRSLAQPPQTAAL